MSYQYEDLPLPGDLFKVEQWVENLRRRVDGLHRTHAYVAAAIQGGRELKGVRAPGQFWPIVPKVPSHLTIDSVAEHLLRLLAPDTRCAVQLAIWGELDFLCSPQELAVVICAIAADNPNAAQALLELRLASANERLVPSSSSSAADDDTGALYSKDQLLADIARLSLGYAMHAVAVDVEAQLHYPTGLEALDQLEQRGKGQTLREGTAIRALREEIRKCRKAFELFQRSSAAGGVDGHTDAMTVPSKRERAELQKDLNLLRSTGARERAKRQEPVLRARHGDQFETVLTATIERLTISLDGIEALVKEHPWAPNAVVGNRKRLGAAERLYLAAEQAAAWSEDKRDRTKHYGEGNYSAIEQAVEQLIRLSSTPFSRPPNGSYPAKAVRLFTLYRLAFLRDDEALPLSMRNMVHAITGVVVTAKTIDGMSRTLAREIDFDELWTGYKEAFNKRVADAASSSDKSAAANADLVVKRAVNRYRRLGASLSKQKRAEFVRAGNAIHLAMERAFTT